jgi:transcriptional regulator with XRE-family HTH domain
VLAARGLSRRQLADELGIAHTTLRPSFLPSGRAPSQANMGKIRKWLEAAEQETATASPAPSPTYRLNTEQREPLAGYRELDERTVRKTVGVSADLLGEAVAGESLDPKIISRLVNFLKQQPAA